MQEIIQWAAGVIAAGLIVLTLAGAAANGDEETADFE